MRTRSKSRRSFRPIRLVEAEISRPLPSIDGANYPRAAVLVRMHGEPLGSLELAIPNSGLPASGLASTVWSTFEDAINDHLRRDGERCARDLTAAGLRAGVHRCLEEREALLRERPVVSVVVPTHNRVEALRRCLRSIYASDYHSFELIVVDNAPASSETHDLIANSEFAAVKYVCEDRPGRSWARNRGLAEAAGEIVAFADDDVVVDHEWLDRIVTSFVSDPRVGCVTGLILPTELDTPAQVWLQEYGGFDKGFARLRFDLDENKPGSPLFPFTAGVFGSGASMAFRTAVLQAVGGFDPALGSGSPGCGGEELSVFLRVIAAGHRLVYEPAAIVRHSHEPDTARLRRQIHAYGRGLGAYLTACIVDDPRRLLTFAAKAAPAIRYLLSPRSAKNQRRPHDYPRHLRLIELRGLIGGPFAYMKGRAAARRIEKQHGPVESALQSDPLPAGGM
jgi:GT2 family glycosyltransferase